MPIRKENRKMEKVKKYGKFLIAPVIAVAIALLIYAFLGRNFGSANINSEAIESITSTLANNLEE